MTHMCHWPGCPQAVPPSQWGCRKHWFMLPKYLRDEIWATYRMGQEITKDPSPEYIEAAQAVQQWIKQHEEHKHSIHQKPALRTAAVLARQRTDAD